MDRHITAFKLRFFCESVPFHSTRKIVPSGEEEDILQSLAFEAANYNPYAFILVGRAGALPMVALRG